MAHFSAPCIDLKSYFYFVFNYVQFLCMEPPSQTAWQCPGLNAEASSCYSAWLSGCNLVSSLIVLPAARTELSLLLLQKPVHSQRSLLHSTRSMLHSYISFQSTTRKIFVLCANQQWSDPICNKIKATPSFLIPNIPPFLQVSSGLLSLFPTVNNS